MLLLQWSDVNGFLTESWMESFLFKTFLTANTDTDPQSYVYSSIVYTEGTSCKILEKNID